MFVNTGSRLRSGASDATVSKVYTTTEFRQLQVASPPAPSSTLYANQLLTYDSVTKLIKNVEIQNGWRNPANHRRVAIALKGDPYDYTSENPTTGWVTRFWSSLTPVANPSGPGSKLPYHGMKLSGGVYVPDVYQNQIARAETECLAKLQEAKVNLATSFFEASLTAKMLSRSVIRLVSAYRATKLGNYKLAAKHLGLAFTGSDKLKDYRSAWLQMQYGWLPLMGDIYGSLDAIRRGVREKDTLVRAERTVTQNYPPFGRGNHGTWDYRGDTKVGVKVILYARVNSSYLDTVGSLGFLNPFEVAWELVPFSFVLDWLIPVGTFLQALTTPMALTFVSGTQTQKSWSNVNISFCAQPDSTGKRPRGVIPKISMQNLCMQRIRYLSFPFPSLYVKSPFSTKHMLSAIALIRK